MAPNRIVILRHGEKPGDPAAPDDPADPNLSPPGVERADMLVTLIPSKFGNLNFLVAAENSNKSHRPVETLQPLANKLEFNGDKFIQTYANDLPRAGFGSPGQAEIFGYVDYHLLASRKYSATCAHVRSDANATRYRP